jgi:hypothetical protein
VAVAADVVAAGEMSYPAYGQCASLTLPVCFNHSYVAKRCRPILWEALFVTRFRVGWSRIAPGSLSATRRTPWWGAG